MGEQQKIRPFPPRNGGTKVHVEPFRVVRVNRTHSIVRHHTRHMEGHAWDNRDRYTAQSILISGDEFSISYLPTLDEARDILAWAGRGAHV